MATWVLSRNQNQSQLCQPTLTYRRAPAAVNAPPGPAHTFCVANRVSANIKAVVTHGSQEPWRQCNTYFGRGFSPQQVQGHDLEERTLEGSTCFIISTVRVAVRPSYGQVLIYSLGGPRVCFIFGSLSCRRSGGDRASNCNAQRPADYPRRCKSPIIVPGVSESLSGIGDIGRDLDSGYAGLR
jgi:hypothetical protein